MSNRTEQIKAVRDIIWRYHYASDTGEKCATAIVDTEIKKAELRGRIEGLDKAINIMQIENDDVQRAKLIFAEQAELKGLVE